MAHSSLFREGDGWLRSLVERMSDVAVLVDSDGVFHYVTPSIEAISGRPPEEMVGERVWDWLHPDDHPVLKSRIAGRIRGDGDPEQYTEIRFRHRELGWRILQVRGSRYEAPTGEAGVLTVARDITAQRTAEKALEERERRFRALVENAADMTVLLAADGTVRYASPSVKDVFGYEPEELEGRAALDLTHPDDRERMGEMLREIRASRGGLRTFEYRAGHRDGRWLRVESRASNLLHDPAVSGIVVNTRDVTETRALEERLRRSQRLEAVGRLAGGIAHDFNNLLTVIRANASHLLSQTSDRAGRGEQRGAAGIDPGADSGAEEEIQEIQDAAERGASLVRALLHFGRRHEVRSRRIEVNALVDGLVERLAHTIGERRELSVDRSPDPLFVEADDVLLEQVLTELLVNAREATSPGGRIVIATGAAEDPREDIGASARDESDPTRYVSVEIRDSGRGMDAETLDRIFEPFFTGTEGGDGSGLGLSTVYGIVEQLGGHIRAESEPEAGSAFRILLPAV